MDNREPSASSIGHRLKQEGSAEMLRYSQTVRASRNLLALWIALVISVSYLILLERSQNNAVSVWVLFILLGGALREKICARIRRNLRNSELSLEDNEFSLQASSYFVPFLIGVGYWIVAWSGDSSLTMAVLMGSILYAAGSTLIQSMHLRSFLIGLSLNLFQGILFFLLLTPLDSVVFAVNLACLWLVLALFGRENNKWITESIRMRVENRDIIDKLQHSRESARLAFHQAISAEQEKNRFFRLASHDLKQPLHAIGLYLGVLGSTSVDKYQADLIDCISQSESRLRDQFSFLLDLSKPDANLLEARPQQCELHLLLREIVTSLKPEAQLKNIALELESIPCSVYTDPILLDRLLCNLIGNAIRYTDVGYVKVSINQQSEFPVIRIEDSGKGIAKERIPYIFDEYVRGGNEGASNVGNGNSNGSGLGLAIVKRIGDILGVDIQIDSVLDRGTVFEVEVPNLRNKSVDHKSFSEETKSATDPEINQVVAGLVPNLKGHKILIVDDDPHNADALSRYVNHRHGESICSVEEEEIKSALADYNFSFAIIDDMLERQYDGLDVADVVATCVSKNNILLVSGAATAKRIQFVKRSGYSMLLKPVSQGVLDWELARRLNALDGGS